MCSNMAKIFNQLLYLTKLIFSCNSQSILLYLFFTYYNNFKKENMYKIKTVDSKSLYDMLKMLYIDVYDVNNTIIIRKKKLTKQANLCLLLIRKSSQTVIKRTVFVIETLDLCNDHEMIMNNVLLHNVKMNSTNLCCIVKEVDKNAISFAEKVELSLINKPVNFSSSQIDTILHNYFQKPKIVFEDDIIAINFGQYGQDVIFSSKTKICNEENVYFKCKKVVGNDKLLNDMNEHLCVFGKSSVVQCENIQSFIPKQPKTPCPSLSVYLNTLQQAVTPFIHKSDMNLNPVFLINGYRGSGKEILLNNLALALGMHLYKIHNFNFYANVYAQIEVKIRNVFMNAKAAAPCILEIDNFENFGKNSEGQHDERIINYFVNELNTLFHNNKLPVVLFCSSNEKRIPNELQRIFLKTFHLPAPDKYEREQNLKWLLESYNVKSTITLSIIANKTHGFTFNDLKTLVYYAISDFRNKINGNNIILNEDNFLYAVERMHSMYNESLGAPQVPKVTWSDIGGLNDVKEQIIRTIKIPFKRAQFLKHAGLKRSGILLFGPPGTGKTLIAKAVATECDLCFLSVKGPELLNMYVGQSEQNIRDVFERARQASPCVIFFDELDSLAPNRGMSGDSGGVMDRVVSQLLAEMDGLNEQHETYIIGATNRPDLIDTALLRPGRFDKLMYVSVCTDIPSKVSILKAQTRKFKFKGQIDFEEIAQLCPDNISGADFYGISSTAWLSSVRKLIEDIEKGNRSQEVTQDEVLIGIDEFKTAINSAHPSITTQDVKYYESLKFGFC